MLRRSCSFLLPCCASHQVKKQERRSIAALKIVTAKAERETKAAKHRRTPKELKPNKLDRPAPPSVASSCSSSSVRRPAPPRPTTSPSSAGPPSCPSATP